MLSFHSSSLAALTLSGGILAVLAMPNSVHAGDKIEFSTPSGALDVPRAEIEKEDPSKEESHPASPLNRFISGEYAVPTEVIVVTPARKRDDRQWGSTDETGRDNMDSADDNSDNSGNGDRYDTTSARRSLTTARRDQNPDDSFARFSDARNNTESADPESLRGRLEARDAAEKGDIDGTGRYDRSGFGAASDSPWAHDYSSRDIPKDQTAAQKLSAWSHDLLHQTGNTAVDRVQEKSAFNTMREMMNEQSYSTPSSTDPSEDIQRNTVPGPGSVNYGAENDDLQKRSEDEAMGQILSLREQESFSATLTPERAARDEVPASQRWDVEQRPAILPFPKRPGDVLR